MGKIQFSLARSGAGLNLSLWEYSDNYIGLFGSYGWGDGEWMRLWEADCKSKGAMLVDDYVICSGAPDSETVEACQELGKYLAQA